MCVRVLHLGGHRHDHMVEGSEVVRVTHPSSAPRHIDIISHALGHAHSVRGGILRRWKKSPVVVAMKRDVQDTRNEKRGIISNLTSSVLFGPRPRPHLSSSSNMCCVPLPW